MRALVTGSSGFIGRHMVSELVRRGYDVAGVDLKPFPLTRAPGLGRYAHTTGDMLDAIRLPGCDIFDLVVHCAYNVGGRAGIDGHPEYLARNVQLDSALFEWAVRTSQKEVLYFSSSAVYPVQYQRGFRSSFWPECEGGQIEDYVNLDAEEFMRPDSRYGWAKLNGEMMARAASDAGLRVHVVRPFSGYGGDQDLCYPLPAIVQRVRDHGDPTVWGPPGQVRDWIHVDDVVRGALAVANADERRPVNLCSGTPVEFGDLAARIARAAGVRAQVRYDVDQPTGVTYRLGNSARMLGVYQPTVTLDDGIQRALREVPRA